MTHWVFIALVPPIIWAAINHGDKYAVDRFMVGRNPGALIITTGASGLVMLLVLSLFVQGSEATAFQAGIMILAGFLLALSYVPYMYALAKDEASNVAPLFQLITPLVFVLAFFVLGETLSVLQVFSGLLIILGALILSTRIEALTFKLRTFLLMSLTALMIAANVVIFKSTAINSIFWDAVRYDLVGVALAGLALFLCVPVYRRDLFSAIREHGAQVITVNAVIEVSNVLARIVNGYVTLFVPATLVQFVNGFQPVFIVLFGMVLTRWFPSWGSEALDRKSLLRKGLAVCVMVLGLILLSIYN